MVVFTPELPPLKGFVEDVDENGVHYYQKVPEQIEKEEQRKSYEDLVKENKALKAQFAKSDDAAIALFEIQAAQAAQSSRNKYKKARQNKSLFANIRTADKSAG